MARGCMASMFLLCPFSFISLLAGSPFLASLSFCSLSHTVCLPYFPTLLPSRLSSTNSPLHFAPML